MHTVFTRVKYGCLATYRDWRCDVPYIVLPFLMTFIKRGRSKMLHLCVQGFECKTR